MLDEEVSDLSTPDYTVEMQIAPAEIRPKDSEPPLDFFFEPVGLHVQPGEIVNFVGVTPEHTATAYHPQQGRQQRVPDGVPPFSSPVVAAGGSWMYAFLEEGVYDILCAPHEVFGMVMRVVVGDETDPTRGETDPMELRPPEGSPKQYSTRQNLILKTL
jgi:plastocyanin